MFINEELAQFCIINNTIEMSNNLHWNTNEMCISYFLECEPYWWGSNYWRCWHCGNYNEGNVCHYCGKPPNKF